MPKGATAIQCLAVTWSAWVGLGCCEVPIKVLVPKELKMWCYKQEMSQGDKMQENLPPEVVGCFPGTLRMVMGKRWGCSVGSDRGLEEDAFVSPVGSGGQGWGRTD